MDMSMFTILVVVLVLAGFLGYHVILGVTPALHTPLMAVTNAISGVVLLAAMLVAGYTLMDGEILSQAGLTVNDDYVFYTKIAGFLGVVFASINIFGGFVLTRRMLAMFRSKKGQK